MVLLGFRIGRVADKFIVCIRPGCQKSIHRHRNKQGNGDTHEKDQLSHRKDGRSRREIDNGQYDDQMDHYRLPPIPSG